MGQPGATRLDQSAVQNCDVVHIPKEGEISRSFALDGGKPPAREESQVMNENLFGDRAAATAVVSACGRYRYSLERRWGAGDRSLLWIMLNPSTADAAQDDRTISRCVRFSRGFGFDSLIVGNLYAYRATDKSQLWEVEDPAGPEADQWLAQLASTATDVICAWGEEGPIRGRADAVRRMLRGIPSASYLVMNASGHPRHPLYVHGSTERKVWHP
jgi:hypothetical protein